MKRFLALKTMQGNVVVVNMAFVVSIRERKEHPIFGAGVVTMSSFSGEESDSYNLDAENLKLIMDETQK